MYDRSLDMDHMDQMLAMLKGNVLNAIWSLGTCGGNNPFLNLFYVYYKVNFPRIIM